MNVVDFCIYTYGSLINVKLNWTYNYFNNSCFCYCVNDSTVQVSLQKILFSTDVFIFIEKKKSESDVCFRSVFLAILLTMNLNEETNLSTSISSHLT